MLAQTRSQTLAVRPRIAPRNKPRNGPRNGRLMMIRLFRLISGAAYSLSAERTLCKIDRATKTGALGDRLFKFSGWH